MLIVRKRDCQNNGGWFTQYNEIRCSCPVCGQVEAFWFDFHEPDAAGIVSTSNCRRCRWHENIQLLDFAVLQICPPGEFMERMPCLDQYTSSQ